MFKKFFIICSFFIFCNGIAQAGQEIVAVQSSNLKPFEQALDGFKNVCKANIKQLVLSEMKGADIVEKIQDIDPDMVLAIGNEALRKVRKINNIPIIYFMVLNPQSILSEEQNITGISLNIPPRKQLSTFTSALPEIKRIGIIFDPSRSDALIEEVQSAAAESGKILVAQKVHSSREVPSALLDMAGKIDVLWMLPDLTVITKMNVEFLLLFCLENKLPVIAFSEKYVALGALLSVGIDAFDIGRQAGEMAGQILSENYLTYARHDGPRKIALGFNPQIARKTIVSINTQIVRNLGIRVDDEIMKDARKINF
jgi:putative ABC transport system substrate-binding protein